MRLDLHIPGLLAAPARIVSQLELPEAPALVRWVERARTHETSPGRFGYFRDRLALQHAPIAALAWLGATGHAPANPVLFAAPVHFKAGMHDLVLFAGPALHVTADECMRLANDANAFFGGGFALEFAGGRLFVHVPPEFDVCTAPLHAVLGRPVRDSLPHGADARRLHAWMNEMQMFLHTHSVNRERTARGLPALNGVWPWGEGALPEHGLSCDAVVFAESLPMRGLGRLLGEARAPVAMEGMLPSSGYHVIEMTACIDALDADDIAGWRAAVQRVSRDGLQPALDWLDANRFAEAALHAGDGTVRVLRADDGFLRRARRWFGARTKPAVREEG